MTIYVEYDPNGDGSFNTLRTLNPDAPAPPILEGKAQFVLPDDTQVEGMMLDLTQNPPILIPIG